MRIVLREFFYVSNLLSISRIVLIAPIYYCIKIDTRTGDLVLLGLIVLAIITDVLDGYASRKLNQQTELGRVLDPLADKIAMIVLLAAGVMFRGFPKMLVLLLFYRDLAILVMGAIVSRRRGRILESNIWGKLNSLFFTVAAIVFVAFPGTRALPVLLIASYLLVLISGISYYRVGEPYLVRSGRGRWLLRLAAVVVTVVVILVALTVPLPGTVTWMA